MLIAVVNRKGAAGRTTTAVLLATWLAAQGSTLLVDLDLPTVDCAWAQQSASPPFAVTTLSGEPIERLTRLTDKYGHLVIDTPSHDDTRSRAALTVADTVLVPTRPDPIDLWSLRQTGAMVRDADRGERLRAWILLTMVRDAAAATSARKALEQDELIGLRVLEPVLSWRAEYEPLYLGPPDMGQPPSLAEVGEIGRALLDDPQTV